MNASNIKFARPKVSGVFYSAAVTATAPTSASAALGDAFSDMGYVSEDGIVQSLDRSVTKLKDMGGEVVAVWDETHDLTYTLTPLEINDSVLGEIYGADNVTASTITINADALPDRMYVFDMRLSDTSLLRVVVPHGHISNTGDITFKKGTPIDSELEITAMPDSSGNKAYYYRAAASN